MPSDRDHADREERHTSGTDETDSELSTSRRGPNLDDVRAGRDHVPRPTDGSWMGEGGLTLTPEQNAEADRHVERAREAEPRLTEAISGITAEIPDARNEGLEHRLKAEDSVKRKIADRLPYHDFVDDAADSIHDTVRYTVCVPEDSYASGAQAGIDKLQEHGYESIAMTNYWAQDEGYRGVNTSWRDPETNQTFEVQFHTDDSYAAKETTHPAYQEERLPSTLPDRRAELHRAQDEIFTRVSVPEGSREISRPAERQEREQVEDDE